DDHARSRRRRSARRRALPRPDRQFLRGVRPRTAGRHRARPAGRARRDRRGAQGDAAVDGSDRLFHRAGTATEQAVTWRAWTVLVVPVLFSVTALRVPDGPARSAGEGAVTFTADIAPIVYQNCVTCHRPGEAAPFPLISYADVKKHAETIAKVTASRYMPPWHAAHGYGEFADERRLTDAQIATIADWVNHGMPEGDPSKMPPLPKFTE